MHVTPVPSTLIKLMVLMKPALQTATNLVAPKRRLLVLKKVAQSLAAPQRRLPARKVAQSHVAPRRPTLLPSQKPLHLVVKRFSAKLPSIVKQLNPLKTDELCSSVFFYPRESFFG
jgi:hypothetical protein